MDTNEKQELDVHALFAKYNVSVFTYDTLPDEIKNHLGGGLWTIFNNMIRDGCIIDLYKNQEKYEYTQVGRNRYKILVDKGRAEKVYNWLAIATFAIAGIGALYGILTYYATASSNNPQSPKQPTFQQQPEKSPVRTKTSDTAMD